MPTLKSDYCDTGEPYIICKLFNLREEIFYDHILNLVYERQYNIKRLANKTKNEIK